MNSLRTNAPRPLLLFALLLLGLPLVAVVRGSSLWTLLDGLYRAGALVFGGGHVVLPLLQSAVVPVGAVSNADFLAGMALPKQSLDRSSPLRHI